MGSDDLARVSAMLPSLLSRAGYSGAAEVQRLPGGGNNRVYRVDVDGRPVLLKAYFRHPGDPRDRLSTEFAFLQFAWRHGIRSVPQPLTCEPEHQVALYEFVDGRRPQPSDITEAVVQEAIDFYLTVNRFRDEPEARQLPAAAEACFSLEDHLNAAAWRLERLVRIDGATAIDRDAAAFVRRELIPAWEAVRAAARRAAAYLGFGRHTVLPEESRRLSPSDFSFHNAIAAADGRLRFVDFEYAGWDDPAKMVCDFFCHVAAPVPAEYLPQFAGAVVGDLPRPDWHRERFAVLLPVHQLKWCCILLNEFLPVAAERRRFAHDDADAIEQKARQLDRARAQLAQTQHIEHAEHIEHVRHPTPALTRER